MEKLKPFLKKLLYPPLWLLLLLTALSAAALTVVFANGWDSAPIAYGIYVLSFYTLTVLCIFCVRVLPGSWRQFKAKIYASKLLGRYLTDRDYKTRVSLHRSLAINLLYAGLNLVSGLLYKSAWFHILAGYYLILSVMRFLLVRFVRKTGIGQNRVLELRRSRLCAWILLLVNVALSGAVMMMMYQGRGYDYGRILIYVMALYTFYITISAILDLFKYRRPGHQAHGRSGIHAEPGNRHVRRLRRGRHGRAGTAHHDRRHRRGGKRRGDRSGRPSHRRRHPGAPGAETKQTSKLRLIL